MGLCSKYSISNIKKYQKYYIRSESSSLTDILVQKVRQQITNFDKGDSDDYI